MLIYLKMLNVTLQNVVSHIFLFQWLGHLIILIYTTWICRMNSSQWLDYQRKILIKLLCHSCLNCSVTLYNDFGPRIGLTSHSDMIFLIFTTFLDWKYYIRISTNIFRNLANSLFWEVKKLFKNLKIDKIKWAETQGNLIYNCLRILYVEN